MKLTQKYSENTIADASRNTRDSSREFLNDSYCFTICLGYGVYQIAEDDTISGIKKYCIGLNYRKRSCASYSENAVAKGFDTKNEYIYVFNVE